MDIKYLTLFLDKRKWFDIHSHDIVTKAIWAAALNLSCIWGVFYLNILSEMNAQIILRYCMGCIRYYSKARVTCDDNHESCNTILVKVVAELNVMWCGKYTWISCCMCVLSITGLVHGDCGQPLPQTRQNKCNWGSTVVVDMLYGTSLYTIYCRYITVNVTRYWTRFDSVKDIISFRPSTDKRHLIRCPYVRAMGRLLSVLWIYYAARYAEYTVLSRD